MKFYIFLSMVVLPIFCMAQEGGPLVIPHDSVVVPLAEMTDEHYADFREGRLGDIVVRVDEGSLLNTHFVIMGDTMIMEDSPAMKVRLLRNLFLRVRHMELEFSLDCQRWGKLPEVFHPNLAMMISVEHDVPTGAFALFLTERS